MRNLRFRLHVKYHSVSHSIACHKLAGRAHQFNEASIRAAATGAGAAAAQQGR